MPFSSSCEIFWRDLNKRKGDNEPKIKEKELQLNEILGNPLLFPKKPPARVKFAMAVANFILVGYESPPSKENRLRIDVLRMPQGFAIYLWTALMVFGKNLPHGSFGHESIEVTGMSLDGKNFEPEKELGKFWWTFSTNSLYERLFKYYLTKDMLTLTENPEFFVGVSSQLYKTVDAQINAKERTLDDELQQEKDKERQIKKLLNTPHLFPTNPSGRVKFVMALASLYLVDAEPLSKDYLIVLSGTIKNHLTEFTKYLWTALMVFGIHHPRAPFNHEVIKIDDWYFSVKKELGGRWSTFSANSLYETVFKHYLMDSMLVLTNNPEIFEGISSKVYKTIDEQIQAKELELQGITPLTEEIKKQKEKEQQETITSQSSNHLKKPLLDFINLSLLTADEWLSLGLTYYEGTKQDYATARHCFEKASEKKKAPAFHYLGKMYQYAQGVERNSLRAARYYQLAIYLGYTEAQKQLTNLFDSGNLLAGELTAIAQMYDRGDLEIIKDRRLAIALYEKASQLKDPSAAFYLAQLHLFTEDERQKDVKLAFSYYLTAAKLGKIEALTPLERLAEDMNSSNQLVLSKLYGTFFNNNQKAAYWRAKAMEATQPQISIQFN